MIYYEVSQNRNAIQWDMS